MDDFVAYKSPWRIIFAILGSFVFVSVIVFIFLKIIRLSNQIEYSWVFILSIFVLIFGVLFFGMSGFVFFKRLFGENEILRVNLDGVRWTRWSNQTIPWKEIVSVTTYQYQFQKYVVLHLRDRTLYPGHGVMGILASANRMMTGGDISIVPLETNRTFSDTLSAIERFRAAAARP